MRDAEMILGLISKRGKQGLSLERVYRLLFNQSLFLKAYGKIYRNKGSLTPGVTKESPDGMSLERIDAIIEALRYERYQWLPARRTFILKKNGKKRPLGVPVWSNKLVQEVIHLLLEAYYEPQFSEHSHGFRPERSCATALREIYYNWHGTTWFIEGDIAQCFEKLDHELLLNTLSEKIHDGRFLNLMRDLFQAGYVENWSFHQTPSGVPQGGIVSPLLANILLDKLDKYVETVLLPKYTRGKKRRANAEYEKLGKRARRERRKGHVHQAKVLRKHAQTLPSLDVNDPTFRRLRYVRYADDFLLGFTGPRSEAEEIKQQLEQFLREELKLELSSAKTLITHARTQAARFLGYEVTILHDDTKHTYRMATPTSPRVKCRSINGTVGLRVPKDVIKEKCQRYQRGKKAIHRAELMHESAYAIVMIYQLEFRGIVNYYRLAYNMSTLQKLKRVMQNSLVKTLACKYKMSVAKIYKKYGTEQVVEGTNYKVLQVSIPRADKPPLVATWGGIPLVWDIKANLEDETSEKRTRGISELVQRLVIGFCEHCGSTENMEVHHVRAMKDLHEYPGREKPEWVKG